MMVNTQNLKDRFENTSLGLLYFQHKKEDVLIKSEHFDFQKVKSIHYFDSGFLALTEEGNVYHRAQKVEFPKDKQVIAIHVSAYLDSAFAITDCGSVYAWGDNEEGQLGIGHNTSQVEPCLIATLHGKKIVQVSGGIAHTLALTKDGEVYSWGWNNRGQLGLGFFQNTTQPTLVRELWAEKIVQISAGASHSLALTENGKVYAWGKNDSGQLGIGYNVNQETPKLVKGLSKVEKVCTGGNSFLALIRGGNLYVWGSSIVGQLGLGEDSGDENTPQLLTALNSEVIIDVSGQLGHFVAIAKSGNVYSWGSGNGWRLGLTDDKDKYTPQLAFNYKAKALKVIT